MAVNFNMGPGYTEPSIDDRQYQEQVPHRGL